MIQCRRCRSDGQASESPRIQGLEDSAGRRTGEPAQPVNRERSCLQGLFQTNLEEAA